MEFLSLLEQLVFSLFLVTFIGCSKKQKSRKEAKNPARSSTVGRPPEVATKPSASTPVEKEKQKTLVDTAKSPKSSRSPKSSKSHKEGKDSPKGLVKDKESGKKEKNKETPERSRKPSEQIPEPSGGTSTARTGPPLPEPMETAKENESSKKASNDGEEGHDGGYEKLDALSNDELKRIAEEAPN